MTLRKVLNNHKKKSKVNNVARHIIIFCDNLNTGTNGYTKFSNWHTILIFVQLLK